MRGKDCCLWRMFNSSRITPAHAGKRNGRPESGRPFWDHPRTCGEKRVPEQVYTAFHGSPPHMRGKVTPDFNDAYILRITPAHAGKSKSVSAKCTYLQDHPRTCGEKLLSFHCFLLLVGSPPHMRGKAKSFVKSCRIFRITPTHAGKRFVF